MVLSDHSWWGLGTIYNVRNLKQIGHMPCPLDYILGYVAFFFFFKEPRRHLWGS